MLVLFFLLLGLGGCEMAEKSEKRTTLKTAEAPATLSLRISIEPLPTPLRYRAVVSWPPLPHGTRIFRQGEGSPPESICLAKALESACKDEAVVSGETYTYALHAVNEAFEMGEKLHSATITIPQDLIVRGEKSTAHLKNIQRLYLEKGAILTGVDGVLRIEVDELHTDGAVVRSLPPLRAAAGQPGRSGGLIYLKAQHAVGSLKVEGRGESGGNGFPGTEGAPGAIGPSGKEAVTGLPPVPESLKNSLLKNLEDLRTKAAPDDPGWKKSLICMAPPTDGSPGGNGGQGGIGGSGGPGGDASRIWIEVRFPDGFDVEPILSSGLGGQGGPGGKGGLRGPGGKAGTPDPHGICPLAKTGEPGDEGKPGPEGKNGEPGQSPESCLILGAARLGNCDPVPHFLF